MKRWCLTILFTAVFVTVFGLAACSQGGQGSISVSSSASFEEASSASSSSAVVAASAYGYTGSDPVEAAAYKYMVEEIGKSFEKADASIPIVQIVSVDNSNPDNVLVYGDFWVYNYNVSGETLECVSGGNFPGVMHMAKDGEGYVVNSFDMVADGTDFEPSAKELYGEHYIAFIIVYGDNGARDERRKVIVSDYVKQNGLAVTQYQDYGWDPVKLDK